MVRNGNDGALPSKKAEAHFGVSAPSQIKWHSGRTPLPPGAFGMSATTSTALGPMQCGTGRGGALMPSPLSTSPANAPGCTQRREGDSPSFFAATADRCGRVAHTPIATSRRYRRGSMWAGRPHSYGGQQLRIGEDQCGRVAHTPITANCYKSPISSRIDCLVSASRSGKRLGSNAPTAASFKPKNSDAGSAPSELSEASPAKPRPCA